MSSVYLLLGAQGAGKTSWARAKAGRLDAVILASDDVRNELESTGAGDPNDGDLVFHIVEEELNWLLSQGKDVIVDATHARRKWRKNHIAIARGHGARVVCVWFDAPLEVCLARNASRPGGAWGDRVVPEEMVRWVWQGFEKPEVGEFDEVWKIDNIGFGRLPESTSPDNPIRSGGR